MIVEEAKELIWTGFKVLEDMKRLMPAMDWLSAYYQLGGVSNGAPLQEIKAFYAGELDRLNLGLGKIHPRDYRARCLLAEVMLSVE